MARFERTEHLGGRAPERALEEPVAAPQAAASMAADASTIGAAAAAADAADDRLVDLRCFHLRPADEQGQRMAASMLINRMYSRRGYDTSFLDSAQQPNRITLVAGDNLGRTLATIAIGLDSPVGLAADELYRDEIDAIRAQGRSVCEFGRLAADQQALADGKRVLAPLFHLAFIYARLLNGADEVVIEVNPRHAPFYRRMLGFRPRGKVRVCPRVNAPAVLLSLDLAHAQQEIARLGGRAELGRTERSLYPYFFSEREQAGLAGRLRSMD